MNIPIRPGCNYDGPPPEERYKKILALLTKRKGHAATATYIRVQLGMKLYPTIIIRDLKILEKKGLIEIIRAIHIQSGPTTTYYCRPHAHELSVVRLVRKNKND